MAVLKLRRDAQLLSDDVGDEVVTCFVSGRRVAKRDAVLVRIGPRQKVWMLPEYCNDRDEDGRAETG